MHQMQTANGDVGVVRAMRVSLLCLFGFVLLLSVLPLVGTRHAMDREHTGDDSGRFGYGGVTVRWIRG